MMTMKKFDDWAATVVEEFSETHPSVCMNMEQWSDLVDIIAVRASGICLKIFEDMEQAEDEPVSDG